MKKLLFLALVSVMSHSLIAQNIQAITPGTQIPMASTKMKSINGKEYSIKDMMGKNGVLVMFSCNTCPYVIRYQARTLEAIEQAKANGYGVIIINSNEAQRDGDDSFAAMQAYAKNQKYNVPYVVDKNNEVANAFGATRTPECFLFDNKGTLVYHGAIDDSHIATDVKRLHLKEAMQEAAKNKDVSVKQTRSVGCTIKRVSK